MTDGSELSAASGYQALAAERIDITYINMQAACFAAMIEVYTSQANRCNGTGQVDCCIMYERRWL